jgi:CheY-like chemotaxis protein
MKPPLVVKSSAPVATGVPRLGDSIDEARPTVFIAEDDPDFRAILADALRHEGLAVVLFPTGQDLLSALERQRPDVIVTDIVMPGMFGPELLALLRESGRWRDIPVVVMTGINDTALPVRLNAPVIAKPEIEELLRAVWFVVRQRKQNGPAAF